MLDYIKNTFSGVIAERITSPLYGTFIFSWCVCNWKIIYITLFVDQELTGNKIYFIERYYMSWGPLFAYPLISTAFLLFGVPYIANFAYQKSLEFQKQRRRYFEEAEKSKLLSVEESNHIMTENFQLKEGHQKQIASKDNEISVLQQKIIQLSESYKIENDKLKSEKQRFKFTHAVYGKNPYWEDITEKLNLRIVGTEVNFKVSNDSLNVDPVPGVWKQLVATCEADGKTHSFVANELDTVAVFVSSEGVTSSIQNGEITVLINKTFEINKFPYSATMPEGTIIKH